MYSDSFPKLRQKYNFDNFEEIFEALETHFHGLFNLTVLEEEIKHKRKGSYTEFFDKIISQLNSRKLFTVGEISQKISEILQADQSVRTCFLEKMVFVPPFEGKPSSQLGFLEKTATGQLKPAEPVTYLDMLRLTEHIKHRAAHKGRHFELSVFNLLNIQSENAQAIKLRNNALIVNFNRDPKGLAKWGVVDLRNKMNPQIYCETPLLEEEKKELEKRLAIEFQEVSARKAINLISTGYTAIAWLDQNISKTWLFDVSSDFNFLLGCYVFAQFRGDDDAKGVHYSCYEQEYNRFCTEAFKRINKTLQDTTPEGKWSGYLPIKLTAISALPNVAGKPITPNSLVDVIRIFGENEYEINVFDAHWKPAYRSNIPGLVPAMTRFGYPPVLRIENELTTLTVPDNIDQSSFQLEHKNACRETETNSAFFNYMSLDKSSRAIPQRDMATAMVLNTFRGQSKQPKLKIHLPAKFNLNLEESLLIKKQVQDNAHITELLINEANHSLRQLRDELLPVLGRNSWLKESGYLPPMVDNYWQRVARFWLLHLNEADDLAANKKEHKIFKQCIEDMGVKGLSEVLSFLRDSDLSENLLSIYGRNRPLFYLSCQQHEVREYLALLSDHLRNGYSFPFNQISAAYQPGNDKAYIALLEHINEKDSFEQINLAQCLRHKREFAIFLSELARAAQRGRWTGLIVIPELEGEETTTEEYRELRSRYRQLNNVILNNRHLKQGAMLSLQIRENSRFDYAKSDNAFAEPKALNTSAESIKLHFDDADKGPWPLQRGSGVQLQMQQQQEIQQNRQIQQEQQRMGLQVVEEVITSELVTYDNIDRLLGKYYQDYIAENQCDVKRYAPLGTPEETPLQAFFHTWINAEPRVKAPHVISAMTLDAAKVMLRHHTRLSSGPKTNNTPKGIYTQRSKDGQLILCYNIEMGYVCGVPTPLTVDLQVTKPVQEFWEGDFRQFNIDYYLEHRAKLETADDFQPLVLFEVLQPVKDYSEEWKTFSRKNPDIAAMVKDVPRVLRHWQVFIQAWQYGGPEAITAFFKLKEQDLLLKLPRACDILFSRQPELAEWTKMWAKREQADISTLRALGQVYYRNGEETLGLLIAKFRQIENQLGIQFFDAFHSEVLSKAENYNFYISPAFFSAIDSMIEHLAPARAQPHREAWLGFCSKHLNHVPAEHTEVLWKAFDYLVKELAKMDLSLSGDEFSELEPRNMLVEVDRILDSLRSLPAQEEKTRFLKSLHRMDLTHGGVHYAIQQEHFKYFDEELALSHFKHGKPTYAPELSSIFNWTSHEAALNIRRTLASRAQFSHEDYSLISEKLANNDLLSRHQLLWLLYTQYDARQMAAIVDRVQSLPVPLVTSIASHLHEAIFRLGHAQLSITLNTLDAAKDILQTRRGQALLAAYPHGNFLEALDLLMEGGNQVKMPDFLNLFEIKLAFKVSHPQFLQLAAYKAATLFGAFTEKQLRDFIQATDGLTLAVMNELDLLLNHLFSVNFNQGNPQALHQPKNWDDFLRTIGEMNNKPVNRTAIRKQFISRLSDQNIVFKYSRSGEFRNLVEEERPAKLGLFVDHQHRLWTFLKNHIVIPTQGDAAEALQPLLAFFTSLQLNRTYLNEVEPLLAILEKTAKDQVWSASYFSKILDVLKPEDEQVPFPLDMLQVILADELLKAKPIDNAEKDFPQDLIIPLKGILKNTVFTRPQQTALCQLALHEYQYARTTSLLTEAINLLSSEQHATSRDSALQILNSSLNKVSMENRFAKLRQLLNHPMPNPSVKEAWPKSTALWLKAIAADPREENLFNQVMAKLGDERSAERALVFHIIAWSCLQPGLRDKEAYEYELDRKAPKLIERLSRLSLDELTALASTYPKQPSPGADDLIRLLKRADTSHDFKKELSGFLKKPHPEIRPDHSHVPKTRAADLRRMFTSTRVTDGKVNRPLTATEIARISLMFAELKRLETGEAFVEGCNKAIADLSRDELAEAFHRLCKSPASDSRQVQIWALEFHALGLTTRKYPHMAQQFALIANDVAVTASSRVLRLGTGEGKSHFVAMRAAKKAAQGQTATVFTAKRSLAERDLEDYQAFYDYLNISTSTITPKSSRESYTGAQVHYTTLGDLSLFLDEQSFQGQPIDIDPDKSEGLGDEFDDTYFGQGRKMAFNYARPTGRTPKQMIWFYRALNDFYEANKDRFKIEEITRESVTALLEFLIEKAQDDEEKTKYLVLLARDGLQLVSWIQSAHEAMSLQRGEKYSVLEDNVPIGGASYLLKEIVPLTTNNHKATGSTFSAGVHQLVATNLNEEAKKQNEAQNYHVLPESHIISSQVAATLIPRLWTRWEGFTATISTSQAQALNKEHGTQVLHVSTNQSDLRYWHNAKFYRNQEQRIEAMLQQLKLCMAEKKSVLFACKNDKKVLEIQSILSARLSKEELENLIFYTNEDKATSSEVLANKQRMEEWKGGKKQKGIALVASGFGRGDNVGVEAVFIFDTGDVNDLLQTGGRTARNGEEGQVFQFYLEDELQQERKQLLRIIEATPGLEHDKIKASLQEVPGNSENEKLFEQVMLLREYVFSLQNAATQGFRTGIAQFSAWGMRLISTFIDPGQASEFTSMLTRHLNSLEKKWLSISALNHLTSLEKIRLIEERIGEAAKDLQANYEELMGKVNITPFNFTPAAEVTLLIQLEQFQPADKSTYNMANLGAILSALPLGTKSHEILNSIPEQLAILATQADILESFTHDAQEFASVEQFSEQLKIRVQQITKASPIHGQIKAGGLLTPNADDILKAVSSEIRQSFIRSSGKLHPSLQHILSQWMTGPGLLEDKDRVSQILPLLNYLGQFSEYEQLRWGKLYLENIDNLLHDTPMADMSHRFSGGAMSYEDNESLWHLAHSFPNDEGKLFSQLKEATQSNYVQRIRMLRRCEDLMTQLPEEDRELFLQQFAKVMQQFSEGVNWDSFNTLVKKTERWWNLNEGHYRAELRALWGFLAEGMTNAALPVIGSLLTEQGKSWYQGLELAAISPEMAGNLQVSHLKLLNQLWVSKYHFSLEQQKQSASVINQILSTWKSEANVREQTGSMLKSYQQFLEAAEQQGNTQFGNASLWYLSSLQKMPSIRQELDCFVLRPPFKLQDLQAQFEKHSFNEAGIEILLHKANEQLMSLEDFCLCCQSLAETRWSKQGETKEKLRQGLQTYTQFLQSAKAQGHSNLADGSQWYLSMLEKMPVSRQELVRFTNNPPFSLETLQQILAQHSFSDAGTKHLLLLANQQHMTAELFKTYCQVLASVNWSLQKESSEQLKEFLQVLEQFLQRARHERHSDLIKGAQWFVSLFYKMPALSKELQSHAANCLFSLEDWQNAMGDLSITQTDVSALLRVARQLNQNLNEFSACCQSLNSIRKIVEENALLNLADKKAFDQSLKLLPASSLAILLKAWGGFQVNIQANPASLMQSLRYAENRNIKDRELEPLLRALFMAVGSEPQSSPQELAYIFEGIDRFQQNNFAEIGKLNAILQSTNKLPQEQYLHDNLAVYLSDTPDAHQDAVKDMAEWFYKKASDCRGDVELMKENIRQESWYQFDNKTVNQTRNRVMWLHMLNHQAFVNAKQNDTRRINWSDRKNEMLLEDGLKHYTQESRRILAQKPSSNLRLVRDLSPVQQQGLFQIANELAIIGKPNLDLNALHGEKESKALLTDLEKNLTLLGKQYKGAWFKSETRDQQINSLLVRLNSKGAASPNRYIELLNVLRETRNNILDDDIAKNQQRSGRKLNQSGHSRLLSTINQMEDQIVRHWVQDITVLQDFQAYEIRCKEDIMELTAKLETMAKDYLDDIFSRNGFMDRTFWRTANQKENSKVSNLRNKLNQFIRTHEGNLNDMGGEELAGLIQILKEEKFSGHLQTISQEILSRAESLSAYLIQRKDQPHPAQELDRGYAG
ncbi:hypothetical protein [Legionella sp. 16cNR16C]|uniref:hypothetical protein n=1 Tax=Legionella sp. 16cNR16C TaxID=2905656 RepID=UPI001E4819C7|nr:hypothetical protein [Legionella sp. 16cNR16C]MCE3044609.1 hypothetical protein [Legionella sp. 16cNR16C]